MEGHDEFKSLRTRRELATTPAWVLSRGIEMAKTENRKRHTLHVATQAEHRVQV